MKLDYTFNLNDTIIIFIAFTGIFIRIFFESLFSDNNIGPANASIIGYGLVSISIISLLFKTQSLSNLNPKIEFISFIKTIFINSIPSLLTLAIVIWILYININYYQQINKGNLTSEYKSASYISIGLQLLQLILIFRIAFITDDDDKKLPMTSYMKSVTYLLTILNVMFLGIITIILEYFSTDG
tara:strand:+ start:3478 stop:4032 length:555 start_codon:yes stop_codon:yes gene_type:complete